MSRSCYSDDFGDEYPGQLGLYRANVERSLRGKVGQARLRELRDALLALPVKELRPDLFATGQPQAPQVCALGAWAWRKASGDVERAAEIGGGVEADDEETAEALRPLGWPRLVVLETVYENDRDSYIYETFEGPADRHRPWDWPIQRRLAETPAERYRRVLAWVEGQLQAAPAAQKGGE